MFVSGEIVRLAELLLEIFPAATVHRYQEPEAPASGQFTVSFKQETRRNETRSYTAIERQFEIITYAETAETAVLWMEAVSRYVMNERPRAVSGEPVWNERVESISLNAPIKLESGLRACSAVLTVRSREPIVFEQQEKMEKVEMRTTIRLKGGMN